MQQLAKRVVDHREQNDPRIGFNPGYHPVNLGAGAHHAPDMLDRLSVVELHKARPGHRMHGFPGGIGNEVKMKARHGTSPELSKERVSHLRLMWKNSVERRSIFELSPACLRSPICCATVQSTFPSLGKSSTGQIVIVVIPNSLSDHSPSLCIGTRERSQSYTHPSRSMFECSQPDQHPGDNIQSSVSTRIQIYHYFSYT